MYRELLVGRHVSRPGFEEFRRTVLEAVGGFAPAQQEPAPVRPAAFQYALRVFGVKRPGVWSAVLDLPPVEKQRGEHGQAAPWLGAAQAPGRTIGLEKGVSSTSYDTSWCDIATMGITNQVRQPLAFGGARVATWQAASITPPRAQ